MSAGAWLVRLAPLADARNFSGVDTARLAFRDRVHLAARVLPAALNTRLALANTSVDSCARRVAARIGEASRIRMRPRCSRRWRWGSPIGMSTDQWRVFNATGTTHLVAISGLHVTLFALVAFRRRALRVALAAVPHGASNASRSRCC